MEHRHTPGPWQVQSLDKQGYRFTIRAEVGGGWSETYEAPISGTSLFIADIKPAYAKTTTKANAQLIAAAPRMLKALELAHKDLERLLRQGAAMPEIEALNDVIRQTIQKATGEDTTR